MISVFLVYWFSHYITCSIWKKSETNTGLWLILPPKTTLKYDMIWYDKKDQTFKQLTFRFNSKSIPNGWSADLKRDTMKLFDCSTITVLLLTLFVWNCFFVLVREKHTHNSLFVLSGWVIPASVNQCWTIAEPIFLFLLLIWPTRHCLPMDIWVVWLCWMLALCQSESTNTLCSNALLSAFALVFTYKLGWFVPVYFGQGNRCKGAGTFCLIFNFYCCK